MTAKLADFGLEVETYVFYSGLGYTFETKAPRYAAPEVFEGKPFHIMELLAADVYSLAMVVFELATETEVKERDAGRETYGTLRKITTSVYSASDSIRTRPSSSAKRIAAVAPGLRAIASAAPDTALACPNPHRPEAIAMPIQAETTGQFVAAPPSCANIGLANTNNAIASKNSFAFIGVLLLQINSPQEVVLTAPWEARKLTLKGGIKPVLMIVRHRAADVNHGQ